MGCTSRSLIYGAYALASFMLLLICFGVVYRNSLVSPPNTCDFGCSLNLLFIVFPSVGLAITSSIAWVLWGYFKIRIAIKFLLMGVLLNIIGWCLFGIYASSNL